MICPNENECKCTGTCAALEQSRSMEWMNESNVGPFPPDKIWLERGNLEYPNFYFDDSLDCEEYTRSALIPRWRDVPSHPGLWLFLNEDEYGTRLIHVPSGYTAPGWKWYGPIPQEVPHETDN